MSHQCHSPIDVTLPPQRCQLSSMSHQCHSPITVTLPSQHCQMPSMSHWCHPPITVTLPSQHCQLPSMSVTSVTHPLMSHYHHNAVSCHQCHTSVTLPLLPCYHHNNVSCHQCDTSVTLPFFMLSSQHCQLSSLLCQSIFYCCHVLYCHSCAKYAIIATVVSH